jgi:WD40 repeat protein
MLCILWSPKNGHHTKIIPTTLTKEHSKNHSAAIWSAQFGPGGSRVVTASKDCTARLWDSTSGQNIVTFQDPALEEGKSHKEAVFGAVFNPHEAGPNAGNEVMSYSLDGTAKLWDSRLNKPTLIIKDHKACVWSACYGNKSGNTILTASHDMTAIVYDKRRQQAKCLLSKHTGILWQACLSADDQYVVTCSDDTTARLWDLLGQDQSTTPGQGPRKPPCVLLTDTLAPCKAAVTCAAFAPSDQEMMATI